MIPAFANRLGAALLVAVLALLPVAAGAVEVQRVISPGGIEAWLIEDHNVPVMSLSLSFRGAGSARDPAGKQGLANMAAGLLDEGAGDMDSEAFQKRLADLSISLSFSADRDGFDGSLATLTENRDEAIRLLALALSRPRFDAEPVGRIRDQIAISLARRAVDPSSLAYRTWFRLAFGEHPYGRPTEGTAESIKAVDAESLRRFVADHFARDRLIVGVAGDINAEALRPLLDKAFGDLPAKGAAAAPAKIATTAPALPPVTERPTEKPTDKAANGDLVVVERPVPQSIAVFGHRGIRREDPDWYAAMILNYVLGSGSFSSRLMEEVREKRGLAYSISTSLVPLDEAGLILGQVATQNDRVAQSVELIRAEWRRLVDEELKPDEIADAKAYLVGSFPISLDSTRRLASTLVSIQENDLGLDYLNQRKRLIESVTPADLKRVAQRLYDAGALTFVVVGRPAGLTPTRAAPDAG